jgi:hypothetical protein
MDMLSRALTGGIIGLLGIWFIVSEFIYQGEIDYINIFIGIGFIGLSLYIIFNKKEDEIEEIKKSK